MKTRGSKSYETGFEIERSTVKRGSASEIFCNVGGACVRLKCEHRLNLKY